MGEQPVGAQGAAPPPHSHAEDTGQGPAGGGEPAGYPPYLPPPWRVERPKVVVRPDLLPAVSVGTSVVLVGALVGWLWSLLAPAQTMVIADNGEPLPMAALTGSQVESYHSGGGLVIFVLLCLAAGLCTGLGVWFLRERRGPVVMVAAVLGSVLGGWLAAQLGMALAQARYPAPTEVAVLDLVEMAPELESMWVLLAWPLTTALMYGLLAAWNAMDDLGRRLG